MDYQIENKPAFTLLAKACKQFTDDIKIPEFWDMCKKNGTLTHLSELSSHPNNLRIGFADGLSFNGKSYMYYIGTPYEEKFIPEGYVTLFIPERTWVVFRCVNLSDQSANEDIFKKIYSEFFPSSDYNPAEYQLEVWPDDGRTHPKEFAEVWISVIKNT